MYFDFPLCPLHGIVKDHLCLADSCPDRTCCKICSKTAADTHKHKFYLDQNRQFLTIEDLRARLFEKLTHFQSYVLNNVSNLGLDFFKASVQQSLKEELLYLQSKLAEQQAFFAYQLNQARLLLKRLTQAFHIQFNIIFKPVQEKAQLLCNTGPLLSQKKNKYLEEVMREQSVQQTVKFLYENDMLFGFNRALDKLKDQLSYVKDCSRSFFTGLTNSRQVIQGGRLFNQQSIQLIKSQYKTQPKFEAYMPVETASKQKIVHTELYTKQVAIEPSQEKEQISEPLMQTFTFSIKDNIFKIRRLDNSRLISCGGRGVQLWNKANIDSQTLLNCQFVTYGLNIFRENNHSHILYGLSNGRLGRLDPIKLKAEEFVAHDSCIRDILQMDNYHFVTASLDRTIKLWAFKKEVHQFGEAAIQSREFAQIRALFKGHQGRVMTVTSFGRNLLSGSSDSTVRMWDVQRQTVQQTYKHQKQVNLIVQIKQDIFCTGGQFNSLKLWDYRKTRFAYSSIELAHQANAVMLLKSDVIMLADRNLLKVFDLRNIRQPLKLFEKKGSPKSAICDCTYLNERQIALGGNDKLMSLWKYNE